MEEFGDLNQKKKEVVTKLNEIEKKGEEAPLQAADLVQRKEYGADFWKISKQIEALARQKSRINWIREGDANSKFFHLMMNFRRKVNSFSGLNINGVWSEDPVSVKQGVADFFKRKFSENHRGSPKLDRVPFNMLTHTQFREMDEVFSLAEIEEAVRGVGGGRKAQVPME